MADICIKYYEDTDCLHGYGVERTVELTRQEAIERITKAIAIRYFEGFFSCENEEIEEYAKAALNAIAPMIPQEDK